MGLKNVFALATIAKVLLRSFAQPFSRNAFPRFFPAAPPLPTQPTQLGLVYPRPDPLPHRLETVRQYNANGPWAGSFSPSLFPRTPPLLIIIL